MTKGKKILFIGGGVLLLLMASSGSAQAAEAAIMRFETSSVPILYAVPDAKGYYNLGFGSIWNYREGRYIQPGDTCTVSEAYDWMRREIAEIQEMIRNNVTVPLTAGMRNAIIDFTYNEGKGAFLGSTLLDYLNAGYPKQTVADQFGRWVYVTNAFGQKVISNGLVLRRAWDKSQFLS